MARSDQNRPLRPISDRMHSGIYLAMIGLLSLYALAAWILFGGDYYNDLTFAVVTGLFVMAVAIPSALWLTWRRNSGDAGTDDHRFRDWAAGEFEMGTGRFKGANAAIEALLPIAAVSIGLVALGIIFDIVARHAT
jgi:hypothetical protein